MPVYFHSKFVGFKLKHKLIYKDWVSGVIRSEDYKTGEINIIFVDDEELLRINIEYLKHNYYTDVITFNYNEGNIVSGDVFVSIDRVKENAMKFKNTFADELNRVMVHGVLHLLGYDDSNPEEKANMRKAEDKYLEFLTFHS